MHLSWGIKKTENDLTVESRAHKEDRVGGNALKVGYREQRMESSVKWGIQNREWGVV